MSHPKCSRVVWKCFVIITGFVLCLLTSVGQPWKVAAFAENKSTEAVELKGLRVSLGEPVQVTAQVAWHMIWPHHDTWSFINATPLMARFPDGNLIVTYPLDPDTHDNPVYSTGFQISKDDGAHWGIRYSVIMQHMTMIFIPVADDSLILLPSETMALFPGNDHSFQGPYIRFDQGGKKMVMEPGGVRILNWPWPIQVTPDVGPRINWHYMIRPTGSYIRVGSRLLATVQCERKGAPFHLQTLALMSSRDGGHTWRYYSTIANAADIFPEQDWNQMRKKGFRGPGESSVIRLKDGELMAVFRVGSGYRWHLRRCYSRDNGRTWTKPDVLPAYSVEPRLLRIANGTIALATGRPGIHLWLSTDPRCKEWQQVNIVTHHNKWAPNASYRIEPLNPREPNGMWQTSSYTGLVQIAPNQMLLAYDRSPERAPANWHDLTRVFVMPITVERK